MNKHLKTGLKIVVSILLLAVLFWYVGIDKIWDALKGLSIPWFLLAVFFGFLNFFVGAVHFKILADTYKQIPYWTLLRYAFIIFGVGVFTPGRAGDLLMVHFMKKEGLPLGTGTAMFVIDKLLYFLVIIIFSMIGFVYFFPSHSMFILLGVVIFIMLFWFFFFNKYGWRAVMAFMPERWKGLLKDHMSSVSTYFTKHTWRCFASLFVLFVKWNLRACLVYCLFIGLGHPVSYTMIFIINSIDILASVIPFTLSGLGLRESAGLYLYSQIGVATPVILVMYLLCLVIGYAQAIGAIVFLTKKEDLKWNITT